VLDGEARLDWSGECYADTAEVRWLPSGDTAGRLDLNYEFLD
jgi:hypothetical protein